LQVRRLTSPDASACTRLIVSSADHATQAQQLDPGPWRLLSQEPRLRANRDVWLVFQRAPD